MAKKKYYAVAKGRKLGIYLDWPSAQAQVMGYPGAVYKGFFTREEAVRWLKNPKYERAPAVKKTTETSSKTDTSPKAGQITIYTDGGSINNPGPGGYGVVEIINDSRREFSGGFRLTTNNRMELMGCIVALQKIVHPDRSVTLFSDSSYVVNGITKGWAKNWRKKGWIKADKKPALNADLWGRLLDLVEKLDITFRWVKGHAGNPFNERCDRLAVAAARQDEDGLPVDTGYEK